MKKEKNAPQPVVTRATVAAEMPWTALKAVWLRQYPIGAPRPEALTLVVRLAATVVLVARVLSPTTLLKKQHPDVIDGMVMALATLTTVLLSLAALQGSAHSLQLVAVVFAWFRLIDVMSQRLMEILLLSIRGRPLFSSVQRSLLLGAINLYEIIACYAIIYLANGGVVYAKEHLATATAGLYFSTITALTVGYGDFVPTTDGARRLVMSEIAMVAVFIVAWFPTLAALLFPPTQKSE